MMKFLECLIKDVRDDCVVCGENIFTCDIKLTCQTIFRSVGRWLTPITSLLPLFTNPTCTLTMKTVPWEMPWTPSLNIRFSDHISGELFDHEIKRFDDRMSSFFVVYSKQLNVVKVKTLSIDIIKM